MKKTAFILIIAVFMSCKKDSNNPEEIIVNEDPTTYQEVSSLNLGGVGSAEITTFDPITKRLFAVNNGTLNKIDVISLADPSTISVIHSIQLANYGGYVNSVDVSNGKLAAAIESTNKQDLGKVVVFNTTTYAEEKVITVGALPDMVTYSPDGKFILTANEGEPNANYTIDPEGTVSIISVDNNYSVTTINFAAFESQLNILTAGGFRIAGLGKNFVKDIEPEYITVSADSKTAWVTLQENNAIAVIDLTARAITKILPLGFKDFNTAANAIDVSDRDAAINFAPWKLFGIYMPDAQMGRLNIVTTSGDTDALVYDSKNELDLQAKTLNVYDDARSDDKSIEPEAITLGKVGSKTLAFVGLERVDAVAIYDVTNPTAPSFVKMIKTGDAPEGVLFIPASKSPIQQSLLVVSSENDGVIKVYKANKLFGLF
ncbi:MAG: alkaline phosphatase [Sediminibacterium sp.]|nr:alkaline phosphatase [Sediminibacterium sp.]